MKRWSAEVKSGESVKMQPGKGMRLQLSLASVSEMDGKSVCLYVKVDGKKLVMGNLLSGSEHQLTFNLVFDRDFELSHSWKTGSVHFHGWETEDPFYSHRRLLFGSSHLDDSDEEEEIYIPSEIPEDIPEEDKALWEKLFGKPETKPKHEEPAAAENANAGKDSAPDKLTVKIVEPTKDENDEDDFEEDGKPDDEQTPTPTPKKVLIGKKRAAESSTSINVQTGKKQK